MNIIKLDGYNDIYAVENFLDEYKDLFKKNMNEYRKYLTKLKSNLKILDVQKEKAIQFQQFERVENQPFYSIRHVSKFNPRVIYAYIDENDRIILLTSFRETKTADYRPALDRAKERMKLLEG